MSSSLRTISQRALTSAPRFMAATPLRQQAALRPISTMNKLRTAARSFEPHPFERYAQTQVAAKADWAKHFRHAASTSVVYFPFYALLLGWPYLAYWTIEATGGL